MKDKNIPVNDIIEKFSLQLLAGSPADRFISVSDLKRPGIELAGFWNFFTPERIQVLGMTEIAFLKQLDSSVFQQRVEKLFSYELCCIIVTRDLDVPEKLLAEADKTGIPLLRTNISTTRFLSQLVNYLEEILAPTISVNGVLVEIYGFGVLISGKSGIGKSETAMELVKRGHRLVADDLIMVKKIGERKLVGSAPEVSRYFLEIRGIGIINVRSLFGAGAVKDFSEINMIASLEYWEEGMVYDRLGLESRYGQIMGIDIPKVEIPIKPGRNLAMVLEIAAMNMRMKESGYNAARDFSRKSRLGDKGVE